MVSRHIGGDKIKAKHKIRTPTLTQLSRRGSYLLLNPTNSWGCGAQREGAAFSKRGQRFLEVIACSIFRVFSIVGPTANIVCDDVCLNAYQNSPGQRPRACQSPSTSPQSLVTVPFGYWTPGTGVQKDTIYGILRRRVWAPAAFPQTRYSCFSAFQKSIRKSIIFFIDFGSQNAPKIHPKTTKNKSPKPSRNQSPKISKNQTETYPAKP